jgi:transglutaminase-like putative cysteine protease
MNASSDKTQTRTIYITTLVLLAFFVSVFSMRYLSQGEETMPGGDSAWQINIYHEVEALDKSAEIFIPPPWDTAHARLYSQSLSHPGLRQKRSRSEHKGRDIVLSAPRPGYFSVETTFSIHVSPLAFAEPKRAGPTEQDRSLFLESSNGITVASPNTLKIVDDISREHTEPDAVIAALFNYVSSHIRIDSNAGSDSEVAFDVTWATALGSTRALVALLRTAHLPARVVTGVNLQASSSQQPYYWAEVYDGENWIPMDPARGYLRELPAFYIPLRKGDGELITASEANVSDIEWRIIALPPQQDLFSADSRKLIDILDLNRLSPSSREILALLLLMPLGALATVILRQLSGIRTYGTFTPTLLALAMTHVDSRMATIVLLLVTTIGIALRATLPNLNLQRAPRLAIVFTLVAVSMAVVVSGIKYFDPRIESSVVLLPTVILTMLVDRIYTVYDESGIRITLVRLLWTVVSALASLVVLLQTHWGVWLVSYPEVHAITLAAIILVGLYNGPKLKDLPGLHWLREPPRNKRDRKSDKRQSSQPGESV